MHHRTPRAAFGDPNGAQPLITIHEPERRGNRWHARADIRAKGEHIELTASASDELARKARGWYNRAADWVGQWVRYEGRQRPGVGVFGALPAVAYSVASAPEAIPHDADTEQAAALFAGCCAGDPRALERVDAIGRDARHDPAAAAALERVELVNGLFSRRPNLAPLFAAAYRGSHEARALLAALRVTRTPEPSPVRVVWHEEDYLAEPDMLGADVIEATHDEIGARIVRPHGATLRRVRPSLQGPMLRTFQMMAAAYAGA